MVNTLEKFLKVTGFDRGDNYPCVTSLKLEMTKHKVNEDLKIDVMSYFLYDNESNDDAEVITACSDCGGDLEYDVMDYFQCSDCGKPH